MTIIYFNVTNCNILTQFYIIRLCNTSFIEFLKILLKNFKQFLYCKFYFTDIIFLYLFVDAFREIANDEVDHLFVGSDDDHDNRLSFDEILDHHDAFVGSEATDYGDHLQDIDRFNDEL